jgi:hypothetical protein
MEKIGTEDYKKVRVYLGSLLETHNICCILVELFNFDLYRHERDCYLKPNKQLSICLVGFKWCHDTQTFKIT